MVDRRAAPARDSGGNAEKIWVQTAGECGPVKTAIFSGNNARLYDIDPKKAELQLRNEQFAQIKAEYKSAAQSEAICGPTT
jgi:hypothetical protein